MRTFTSVIFTIGLCLSAAASAQDTRPQLKGKLIQGGMVIGRVMPGSQVFLDSRAVKVSAGGVFVIGFDRDAKAEAQLSVIDPSGDKQLQTLSIQPREYNIQRIDGLPPKKVSPPKEVIERIKQESAAIRKARAVVDDRMDFTETFRWPAIGPITGVYGSQRILNGQPRQPHYGVDIAAPQGTSVLAPASGLVTFAHPDMYFSGATLVIDHGYGVSSSFLHLQSITVNVGDYVMQGDPVATLGGSGRATGPHLDWRMNWLGERIDPELLVTPMSQMLQSNRQENPPAR